VRAILGHRVLHDIVQRFGDVEAEEGAGNGGGGGSGGDAGAGSATPAPATTTPRLRRGALGIVLVYEEEAHAADEWPISSARDAAPGREGIPVSIRQHRSQEEREEAARDMVKAYQVPPGVIVVTDALRRGWTINDAEDAAWEEECARAEAEGRAPLWAKDGEGEGEAAAAATNFENAYAAWPFRYYLMRPGDSADAPMRIETVGMPHGDTFLISDILSDVARAAGGAPQETL
jgi:hypothetical protein